MTTAVMTLNSRVLVLNGNWVPVNVTSVLAALKKVVNERARFVDPDTFATYDFEGWVDNWGDAIKYAKEHDFKIVPTSNFEMAVPSVIVCTEYRGLGYKLSHRKPKFSRTNIFRRDRYTCQYCRTKHNSEDFTLDHVVPISQGGPTTWGNIALACFDCNQKKSNRTPHQAGMKLIRQPFRPTAQDVAVRPIERLLRKVGKNVPKPWSQFLGKPDSKDVEADKALSSMYWNVEVKGTTQ